jgi:DNA invertase Pin-like site-specific DNA recombinase
LKILGFYVIIKATSIHWLVVSLGGLKLKKQKRYDVGIYCRLSKDDMGGGESTSIVSQKNMLEKYVKDNGWTVFNCYIDDGYSGTNFNRPDFERMIDDIEAGKINMVIVKDLSRLGRNYLITGQYTDIYFPDRGVRFIALNDGIDTLNSDNDIAPFKNILNEMYAKDISKKVRSAVRTKKQNGEFLSNYAPIGYKKDAENKNKLVIEEAGAAVVGRIFEMCRNGMGSKKIAKAFNAEGILSPRDHRNRLLGKTIEGIRWHPETVISILRNRIYLGDMVQGVYECSQFKRTPNKRKPPEEWIITPNTHEPIIDTEMWEYVQKCIDSRIRVIRNNTVQLFAGFVKCEDCGYSMAYSNSQNIEQYTCGQYRRHGKNFCSCHYIRKDLLEQVVLDDICKYAKLAKGKSEELAKHLQQLSGNKDEGQIKALNADLERLTARYEELDNVLIRLYEDNISGRISDDRFNKFLQKYETEQASIKPKIEEIKNAISEIDENKVDSSEWLKLIQNYTRIKKLDRIILSELVDKITVGESREVDGRKEIDITIYYRFIGAVLETASN